MGWLARMRGSLRAARATDTFDEEARFHLEQRIVEYVASGMSAEEARQEAYRRFGSVMRSRERTRDEETLPWLRDLAHDLRYAARQLRRNPTIALSTILILAIGIGSNTALFTVVDELLLQGLPVRAPGQLVLFNWLEGRQLMRSGMDGVRTTDSASGRSTSTSFSYATFLALREAGQPLADLFAFYRVDQLNVVIDGVADVAPGQYVSGNYFRALGVEARSGRPLTDADDQPGAAPVVVISHRAWQRRFHAGANVVGRSILINRKPFTIVGIAPPGFDGTLDVTQTADFTVPFAAEPVLQGDRSDLRRPAFLWVNVMGRLRAGATRTQAVAALDGPMQQSMLLEWQQALAANADLGRDGSVRTLADAPTLRAEAGSQGLMDTRRRYADPLLLLAACGALLLLVTCMNLATLLLARGTARAREIATRLALGAGRGRLVRQLFAESLLLAILGSAAGLALAQWGTGLLLIWSPWGGAIEIDATIDWRLLAFSGVMAAITSVLFGLVPAFRATHTDLSSVTRQRGGASVPFARTLIVAQVACSLVLLAAATLFVGTLRNLRAVDAGFETDRLLLFRVQPQLNGYDEDRIADLYARMTERLEAIAGVQTATVSRHPLLSFSHRSDGLILDDDGVPSDGAEVNVVAPGYFETLSIPLALGRDFDERDDATAPPVAVVNRTFATRYFRGGNPIGRHFWFGSTKEGAPIRIVGMVRDARYTDLRTPTQPTVYVPVRQDVPGQASVAVRTSGDPLALVPAVRRAIAEIDPALPLFDVRSQREQAQLAMARETVFARLSTLLGAMALLLVAIGLYGTASYAVARRTAEIGVRMALGARRAFVVRMMLRDAVLTTLAGLAIGIPAALLASRATTGVLQDLLYGVDATDPTAIALAASVLLAVGVLAALRPALVASRVDPVVALRAE